MAHICYPFIGTPLPWTDHAGMTLLVQQPMRHPVPQATVVEESGALLVRY
jgi:hypothetical protein